MKCYESGFIVDGRSNCNCNAQFFSTIYTHTHKMASLPSAAPYISVIFDQYSRTRYNNMNVHIYIYTSKYTYIDKFLSSSVSMAM